MKRLLVIVVALVVLLLLSSIAQAASILDLGGPKPRALSVVSPVGQRLILLPRSEPVALNAGVPLHMSLFDVVSPGGVVTMGGGGGGGVDLGGTNAWTGPNSFQDETQFSIVDEVDGSKKLQFNLDGVTTGNTHVLTFTGTNTTGSMAIPAGSTTVPGLTFTGFTTTGVAAIGGNLLILEAGQVALVLSDSVAEFRVPSDFKYAWSAALNNLVTADTSLVRNSAGVVKVTDGSTGNGSLLAASVGAPSGNLSMRTGTTTERELFVDAAKALTEATATPFVRIALAASTVAGGVIEYTIRADDGTDFQSLSGTFPFSVVNKAGTETCTIGTDTQAISTSILTLTNIIDCDVTPANAVDIRANATSGLTQTTLNVQFTVRRNTGTGAITPQ